MRDLINIAVPFQTFNDLIDFCEGRRTTCTTPQLRATSFAMTVRWFRRHSW